MQSLTPEEQRVLERLKKKLPRMPARGWDKERLLDELGWKGCPCEENWRKVLRCYFEVPKNGCAEKGRYANYRVWSRWIPIAWLHRA